MIYMLYIYIYTYMYIYIWLVVDKTHLKNMSSSIGIMTFPTEWKNISYVPVTTNQSVSIRVLISGNHINSK